MDGSAAELDLAAYLRRVAVSPPTVPDLATLRALTVAHLSAIPFENIDVRLGRPIRLDLGSLQAKLVARRRGGYCFEQNTLFAAVLRALGYRVETLEARVRPPGATAALPRTHMVLKVTTGDGGMLVDVGFGGDGQLGPVPLDGAEATEPGGQLRVHPEPNGILVLQRHLTGQWSDLYAFTLEPALAIDYEVANFYTSTHPASTFVMTLTAQRVTPEVRHILRGRRYTARANGRDETRNLSDDAVLRLLDEVMGIEVPREDGLHALGTAV